VDTLPACCVCLCCRGGIPTNHFGEVIAGDLDSPDKIVPGLLAAGEAASASVHGANRLGANSLLDIVVFGRATALRVQEIVKPNTPFPELKPESTEYCLNRLDQFRWNEGSMKTSDARLEMQKVMQESAAVFRTEETLVAGVKNIDEAYGHLFDCKVADKSLVWNTDLVETLELSNLLPNGTTTRSKTAKQNKPKPKPKPVYGFCFDPSEFPDKENIQIIICPDGLGTEILYGG
jgi:succinate dehydrogenase/fumarate reductase flavoprotein subunit